MIPPTERKVQTRTSTISTFTLWRSQKVNLLLSLLSIASPYTVWMIKFFIETIQSHAMTHVPQFEPAPHVNYWQSIFPQGCFQYLPRVKYTRSGWLKMCVFQFISCLPYNMKNFLKMIPSKLKEISHGPKYEPHMSTNFRVLVFLYFCRGKN